LFVLVLKKFFKTKRLETQVCGFAAQ